MEEDEERNIGKRERCTEGYLYCEIQSSIFCQKLNPRRLVSLGEWHFVWCGVLCSHCVPLGVCWEVVYYGRLFSSTSDVRKPTRIRKHFHSCKRCMSLHITLCHFELRGIRCAMCGKCLKCCHCKEILWSACMCGLLRYVNYRATPCCLNQKLLAWLPSSSNRPWLAVRDKKRVVKQLEKRSKCKGWGDKTRQRRDKYTLCGSKVLCGDLCRTYSLKTLTTPLCFLVLLLYRSWCKSLSSRQDLRSHKSPITCVHNQSVIIRSPVYSSAELGIAVAPLPS